MTKTKIYKNKMMAYVVSIMDTDNFTGDEKEQFTQLASNFELQFNYSQNKQRHPNLQVRFSEWLRGLPTGLGFAFSNYDILQLAIKQGVLKQGASESKEDKIINDYWMVLAMAFLKIFWAHKIELED